MVLDTSCDRQAALEVLLGCSFVGQLHANLAEMEQPKCLPELFSHFTKCAESLFRALASLDYITLLQVRNRERGQRSRSLARVSQAPTQREALRQHRHRFRMVSSPRSQRATHVQRMATGDFRETRERKRSLDVITALGRVTAKDPEIHQRNLELDRNHRVNSAGKRQRDCSPQVVE